MRRSFRGKVRKMMNYSMMQKKDDLPGEMGEFESFEEFMDEFEAK